MLTQNTHTVEPLLKELLDSSEADRLLLGELTWFQSLFPNLKVVELNSPLLSFNIALRYQLTTSTVVYHPPGSRERFFIHDVTFDMLENMLIQRLNAIRATKGNFTEVSSK